MPGRHNYWSCTKFADWLRGTKKLNSGTSKQWKDWKTQSSHLHPFRHWLAEEGLDKLQDTIMWPIDQLYSIKYWWCNRFITKTHTLTSTLPKGDWHELDTRILHCLFDELVNFVEVELAWSHIAWDKETRKQYRANFFSSGWFRTRTWRCPEAGLAHLHWASNLTNADWLDDDKKHEAELTAQAITARELIDLYNWWKVTRPARPDPYDASGWSKTYNEQKAKHGGDPFWDDWEDEAGEDRKRRYECLNVSVKIEEDYYKEDEEMLIRLVRIRRGLWT